MVGDLAQRAAKGRKAPSSNGFVSDREMVPQPRGHIQPGPRVPQDGSLRWLGPAGDRRDTAPTASQCQAVRGQPGSSPPLVHLTVLFPGPPRRSLPALATAEKGSVSPPAMCPPASGAWGSQEQPAVDVLQPAEAARHRWVVPLHFVLKKPVLEPAVAAPVIPPPVES